ncbi:MAG: hypothetical protein R3350_10420, partial [Saprospiraceae bacterium]|nr:hypothetical protein [Saprospiraceae bacterium]
MKIKAVYPIALFLSLCLACESQSNYNGMSTSGEWHFQNVPDASGDVSCQLPLPAGWQVVGPAGIGQVYITGPRQVQVSSSLIGTYFFNLSSPSQAQSLQMTGKQIANPVPIQRILQETLAPQIQQQGGQLTAQYPVPAISAKSKSISELMVRAHGMFLEGLDMLATEWTAPNGTKSLIIVSQTKIRSQMGFSMW